MNKRKYISLVLAAFMAVPYVAAQDGKKSV